MRHPTKPSSAFFHPLDSVLGTAGAVRVLRLLASTSSAFAPPEVAARTGLDRSGVGTILHRLALTGVVEPVGGGRRPLFRLSLSHPIAEAVGRLFLEERNRADAVFAVIRKAAAESVPPPLAVWVVGSVARGTDTPVSDVDIVVVRRQHLVGNEPDPLVEAVAQAVPPLGIAPAVIRLSRADVARLRASHDPRWAAWSQDAVVLHGPGPDQLRDDGPG